MVLSGWNLSQNLRKWAQNSIQARRNLHHHILEDRNIKLNNPELHIHNNQATQFNPAAPQQLQWCINSLMLWWPCSSSMSFQYQWTVLTAKLLSLPPLISHQVLWRGCPAVLQPLLGKYTSRISDIGVTATILASFSVYWLKQLWKGKGERTGSENFQQSVSRISSEFVVASILTSYCAFHKHANSKVRKRPSQLRFSLPSIIITITSSEPWNTETHKTDPNPPITNRKPWPFELIKLKFCSLGGPLRWLTAAGAHQMEPPSLIQALGVNPFPSRFIIRTVPRGDFARRR